MRSAVPRYTSSGTTSGLRVRESRLLARLLLEDVSRSEWRARVVEQDLLQLGSEATIKSVAAALRARLLAGGEALWPLVARGDLELATQATLAGALAHSDLLRDFLDVAVRDKRLVFESTVDARTWRDFVEVCRTRDPEMTSWSDATSAKLRSVVYSMMTEAGYLSEGLRSRQIQTVFVVSELEAALETAGHQHVLRSMKVCER